jgi:DNA replication and repair protein RecF
MKVNDRIKGLENIQIKYETSIPLDNLNDIQKVLTDKYKSTLQREIAMAQTMTGPHRDDFIFFVNGKNARDFGSQGQQRMSVLSLKLAEIELFKDKKGEYPVLLLDDVFSELDNVKRHNIIKYLNKRMQIIITTTDINDVEKLILKNASIFSVDKAVVKQIKHNGNIVVNKNGRK